MLTHHPISTIEPPASRGRSQTRHDRKQEAAEAVMGAFPDAEIVVVNDDKELCVHFRFPGCRGMAAWKYGDDNVTLDKVDEQAWLAYRNACRQGKSCKKVTP
ncbi:hypothetical protein PS903_03018 [Pseudomonas fluorescens]|nr:hypothetical protein PS903_03018 [Pseudomonas fluorescens]